MYGPTTWALVSNGVRARILRTLEDGDTDAPLDLVHKTPAPHLRDLLNHPPGCEADPTPRPSATAPGPEPILRDMELFARDMVDLLEDARGAGKLEALVVVAAPKMLGILDRTMPPPLRARVLLEGPGNLVWLSWTELRAVLRRMLRETSKERSP